MEQSPSSSNTTLVANEITTDIDTTLTMPEKTAQNLNSTMTTARLLNAPQPPQTQLSSTSPPPTPPTPPPPPPISQMQIGLSPQPIGREFVRQYYTLMSKSPQLLYRFYAANSTLTFGNGPTIVGQTKIRKDIEKRELHNCHTRIFKIDAQPTLGNGLVVQVIGELSNNNEALRPFTQTFVLTPLVPKNFFVYNEIFRFQDDLQPDPSLESHTMGSAPSCVGTPTELWLPATAVRALSPVLTQQVIAISKSIASIAIQTANETALLIEDRRAPPTTPASSPTATATTLPTAFKFDAILQPTQLTTEAKNLSLLTAVSTKLLEDVQQSSKHDISQTNAVETKIPSIKLAEMLPETENEIKSPTEITTSTKPQTTSTNKTPIVNNIAPLVNPSLTYANVFKSSSGQSLIEQKDSSPDSELNIDISTSYIPSATFTTSSSPNMSPAPSTSANIIATPLIASRLTSPTPDINRSNNNRLPETNTIIPTTTATTKLSNTKIPDSNITINTNINANTNTSTHTTTMQNTFRRNRNESSIGNRFDTGATRGNQRSNNNNNSLSTTSYQTQRRPRPQYERYDDNLQLFLGNLPLTATVHDLTQVFERYGTILELRVLSKPAQPGQRKLPNYGFLTFATTEAVESCLNDLPLYFPENSANSVRLNIRPKNETVTGPSQQQNTRSGKSNMRYDNGGDQIRNPDQNRNRRFLKRGIQETQNGGGESTNVVVSSPRNSSITTTTATAPLKDEWPELGAVGSGGNTQRKGSKK